MVRCLDYRNIWKSATKFKFADYSSEETKIEIGQLEFDTWNFKVVVDIYKYQLFVID
jgi:hypothetical protein